MCGKEYPPKIMSGKPPVSKTYRETINQLAIKSTNALAGKLEKVAAQQRKAESLRGQALMNPELTDLASKATAEAEAAKTEADTVTANLARNLAKKQEALANVSTMGIANAFSSRGKTTVRLPMSGKGTRRNTKTGGDIVTHMLTIRNQVKLYHWQTGSFARHKATDDLTAALDTAIDSFVESYMGKYGRPKVSGSIKLHNFSDLAARGFVATQTRYLTKELPKKIGKEDTDLLNIRDEILGELNKVLYLFTLA
jgi:DNA-binding ferritin-like protein